MRRALIVDEGPESVHGADINNALTSQPEKKPQDSNDLFQALRGLAR